MQSGPLTPVQERQIGLIYSAAFGLSALGGRRDRAGSRWRRAGASAARPVLGRGCHAVGGRDRAADRGGEGAGGAARRRHRPTARIGQPAALNRVLLNLTTNALKFTADGRRRGRRDAAVTHRASSSRSRTPGAAFRRRSWPRSSTPFRRRDSPAPDSFSSAGLGLAICRQLVGALGGELAVTTSDQGTRFSFEIELPLARSYSASRPGGSTVARGRASNSERRSSRIAADCGHGGYLYRRA